ncbi:Cell surface glycoprotein CD200 receptor 1-A, partial [Egretta garzetta]
VGNSFVFACPPRSNMTMVTWKINPKAGGHCTLGYRADQNKTDRTNCSDGMDWKFRPDQNPALEIWKVGIAHEGDYTCELVGTDGNFHEVYQLTVLVLQRTVAGPGHTKLLSPCTGGSVLPVCEAAAGKPAAQISWVLESNSTLEEEGHDDGTVTVLSKLTAYSTNMTHTTCIVFHPAGNQSKSITC